MTTRHSVTVSEDGRTFTIRTGIWFDTLPSELIPDQIALYRGLASRKNGQYAQHYQPTVDALLAARKIALIRLMAAETGGAA